MIHGEEKQTSHRNERLQLIEHLSRLPHRILQHHDLSGLSQLILHELGHATGFELKRAVYLIDNPDFDHLVGAAGFCCKECELHAKDMWKTPKDFSHDMRLGSFHNDIKKLELPSLKRKDVNLHDADEIRVLGRWAGLDKPQIFSWNMKHGNHGILIFEGGPHLIDWKHDLLRNTAALLSLCGIGS